MKKSEQTDQVIERLYFLTQQFTKKYVHKYYKQYTGDVEDLAGEFFVEFMTPKSRIPGNEETLLDKFNPDYTKGAVDADMNFCRVVQVSVQRMLIDRSRQDTTPLKSIDRFTDEFGDCITKSFGLLADEPTILIEDREFTAADINTFQKSFSQLSPKEQRAIELEFETVKNVINKNWAEAFATVLGTTPTSDVLTVEVATEETKIQCYVQQITDRTAVLLIDNAIVEFDINTKQPRNKQLTYRIESDLPKKYHSKIHRKEFAAEMAAQ